LRRSAPSSASPSAGRARSLANPDRPSAAC
jgi:hypothetical protein